jgi:hypothetical protein
MAKLIKYINIDLSGQPKGWNLSKKNIKQQQYMGISLEKNNYHGICDIWRDVQLSSSTKLLPIPSGYPKDTTGVPINARNG